MSETEMLVKEYSKNPLCNYEMQDANVSRHEGNFICGDDITVYLKIQDDKISAFSYDGNPSTVSLAAASFLSEFLIGASLDEILTRNYETFVEQGFEVSPRRRRAAIIALLGVRNAIHKYRNDGIEEDFDELLD